MDDLFAPPDEPWRRPDPAMKTVRRIVALTTISVGAAAAAVGLGLLWGGAGVALAMGLALVAVVWALLLITRNYRSWGYAERADDLFVTHGVLIRRLTVVPYGRMQYVDVESGPIERRFGLAAVQLHTASPATDARIPGLRSDEAARLRDRLSALGEAQAAGL